MSSADRIRVLRVITRLNIGGPAIHAGLLTGGLDRRRFETRLVIGRPGAQEGDMAAAVLPRGADVVVIPSLRRELHPVLDVVTWWRLVGIIRCWRPQVIHTHMAKAGALGRAAARTAQVLSGGRYRPLVLHTFHGHVLDGYFSPGRARVFAWIERMLARVTDRLIAVSPAVKHDLVARGIAPAAQVDVIPLGLPLDALLDVDGYQHRWRDRIADKTVLVAWVGRLVPIKRPELFVEAFARLRADHPSLSCEGVIVGDGELRASVERAIADRGVAGRLRCVGWVTEMPALYADADLVCLTSVNEGTPVAIIEAMAAGKPVIATAVGGVPDVLGVDQAAVAAMQPGVPLQGEGGLLVRSGDGDALALALARCAADAGLRRELGRAGRMRVRQRYAAQRLIDDVERLYVEATCTH